MIILAHGRRKIVRFDVTRHPGSWYESGGEPFVTMMQTADLPDGHDSSDPAWRDGARVRANLVECKIRPHLVVIDVGRKNTPQNGAHCRSQRGRDIRGGSSRS